MNHLEIYVIAWGEVWKTPLIKKLFFTFDWVDIFGVLNVRIDFRMSMVRLSEGCRFDLLEYFNEVI